MMMQNDLGLRKSMKMWQKRRTVTRCCQQSQEPSGRVRLAHGMSEWEASKATML
jgi:hypothetical protein